ncbi:MAG: hypothetical protein N3E50_07750 [Candidatus Goldbacteria bacterium]|nr:hypothetical protein [Candidatus Goldiibacteriota bacterium]
MAEDKKIQKKELFFLFILIIFYFFLNFKFLFLELNKTERKLYEIVTLIKNGQIPYKNITDNTPPFNYYLYLIADKLFNTYTMEGSVRNFTNFYIIFFILLIYIFSRLLSGKTVAMLSSFIYVVLISKNPYFGIYSLPGLFAQFPVFLSMFFLIFIEKEYEHVDYFLSGFFLGVASYIIFSLKFIIFIPIIYIFIFWRKKDDKIKFILWFIFGFILMELLAVLWAIKNSALEEFIRFYFVNNFLSMFYGLNVIFSKLLLNKYYLLFALVFFVGLYRWFVVKKFDGFLILLLISINVSIIALFNQKMDIGFVYLLIPFISVMTSILLKEFILWIKKIQMKEMNKVT